MGVVCCIVIDKWNIFFVELDDKDFFRLSFLIVGNNLNRKLMISRKKEKEGEKRRNIRG